MNILLFVFEALGTVAFSISGVLVGLKKKMDLFGVMVMGLVTAVGGGIIRDILLGQIPPKVLMNPTLPVISVITSLIVFLVATKWEILKYNGRYNLALLVMDSIGLGIVTIVGVETAQSIYGFHLFLNICMGTLTGVGGGVMRDVFSCQIPVIFTKHIYATASVIGSVVYSVLCWIGMPLAAGILAFFSVLLTRMLASKYLWNLPKVE